MREELFRKNVRTVQSVVSRYLRLVPAHVRADDLLAAGMAALWKAAVLHEGMPQEEFRKYAWAVARGAVLDEMRMQSWFDRRTRASAVVMSEEMTDRAPTPSSRPADPEEQALRSESADLVRKAAAKLTGSEKLVFDGYYVRGLKMREVAAEMGVTEAWISVLNARIVEKLRLAILGS